MPGTRRSRVSHQEARRRIAAAADRLLRERRNIELTVERVMDEAGLSRTAFYRHFADLSEVLLARLDQLRAEVLDGPGGAWWAAPEGADLGDAATLRAALSTTVRFFDEHAPLMAALHDAGTSGGVGHGAGHAVAAAHAAFTGRTVAQLASCLPAASFPSPAQRREVAAALVALNPATSPEDDPRRTYVEFTLEPFGAGTRLRVVETGFAQLAADAHRTEYDAHTEGWTRELGELVDYLDAA